MSFRLCHVCLLVVLGACPAVAQQFQPNIAPASREGAQAIGRFKVPQGLRVELVAAEPMLANPVAFWIDEQGRIFVAETFRHFRGVTDNRRHMHWLHDDLAARTVEDRVAYYKKHLGDKIKQYTAAHDRLRLLQDTDGDGRPDQATVFADGFNQIESGIGAGVLARRGNVYFTCIPDLWLLKDADNDGKADERKSLHSGFGVHTAFLGHDLHGLQMGPDGRLYFSIGDRGLNVNTPDGRLEYPHQGAVLRCELDGSGLEVFASGLRNPQELAFDKHGNLFTVDNNSDSGDRARVVYLVQGGDSGWRMFYQYHKVPISRGPFNDEKLWFPHFAGQAAYLVPPLANLSDGPAGLTYHPGVALLPEKYKDHFFLSDFRGSSAQSGIRSFAVRPKGASFEVVDTEQFLWQCLPTDCDFGPDGALYWTDWVEGWDQPMKGRMYRVFDPSRQNDPLVKQTQQLIRAGMGKRTTPELTDLIAHADYRVRLDAQLELAQRLLADVAASESVETQVTKIARNHANRLARLHAIWALGISIRKGGPGKAALIELLEADDAEVRTQAAKVLGDAGQAAPDIAARLIKLLQDPSERVQFHAAIAAGNVHARGAVEPLIDLLRRHDHTKPFLRHAAVMGLVNCGSEEALLKHAADASPAVRMGVLLALRRLKSPAIARFFNDSQVELIAEAARAAHDVPVPAAMPALAGLLPKSGLPEFVLRRALNANFRLGQNEHAEAIARFAADGDAPERLRVEALGLLGQWERPPGIDHVLGAWRPLEPRDKQIAANALRQHLPDIASSRGKVRERGALLAAKLGVDEVEMILFDMVQKPGHDTRARAKALAALEQMKSGQLEAAMQAALQDDEPLVRSEAQRVLAKRHPEQALPVLKKVLASGSPPERQQAFLTLARLPEKEIDTIFASWLDRLANGAVPSEVQLELLEGARLRKNGEVQSKLKQFEQQRANRGPLAQYQEALAGGDAARGREVFFHKVAASCVRCHRIHGTGGKVGPDLSAIGAEKKREYLLAAIVEPNKDIAKGFETVVVATVDGKVHTGILREDDGKLLRLITPEAQLINIPHKDIDERARGKSPMPEDIAKQLSKAEVRDLVEFLFQQKQEQQKLEFKHE